MTTDNASEFELKLTLFKALDSEPRFLTPRIILVETQPIKAREKIKGVGHAIFDYYVLRGYLDKKCEYTDLKFIDAKNKLTVYDGPPISCSKKTQYARNKWYSVQYCLWEIKHNLELTRYFETFKKKDDLADSLMQGLWYLKFGIHGNKGEITSSHQKLVNTESNAIRYKKIRAYAPSKKIKANGRYTLSNIKYIFAHKKDKGDLPDQLRNSICFYFGNLETFFNVC